MVVSTWYPVTGKTYVVLGLARSGLSAVKWLKARGARVLVADDDSNKVTEAVASGGEALTTSIPWETVSAVVQSPGIPLWKPTPHPITSEARIHNVAIIGDGDLFRLAHPNATFVGITGTNGKSTTTALIGHVLKECGVDCQIGGNIGTPMLDLPEAHTYVIELSSYQLDLSDSLNLHVAAWLNISPDHLDRHGSLENYVEAKKKLFKTSDDTQTAIIGVDDVFSESVWREISGQKSVTPVSINKSLEGGIYVEDGWLVDRGQQVLDLSSLPTLKGRHNFQNVAIAYGVCCALGLGKLEISQAFKTFPGLAHRQEFVRSIKGIAFINDSKGTNADATAKALATFDRIYWIAGGKAKEEGIDSLLPYFPKIVHTFLIGDAQERFANTLENQVPFTKSGTLEQAVADSYRLALSDSFANSVILLSPACASFDQFQDFEHRGKVFCQLVQSLEA